MKNEQSTKSTTNQADNNQKVAFLEKVREDPKLPKALFAFLLLFILPFCIILIITALCGLKYIRNDAYNYTDDAYNYTDDAYSQITTAIMGGTITLEDGTEEELTPCIQKDIGVDVITLKKFVDSFELISENDSTKLICSIKDGYFEAKVTTTLSNEYEILSMSQNFDSLGQYMDSVLHIFVLAVLMASLVIYLLIAGIILVALRVYGAVYRRLAAKKKKEKSELEIISLDEQDETNSTSTEEKSSITEGSLPSALAINPTTP